MENYQKKHNTKWHIAVVMSNPVAIRGQGSVGAHYVVERYRNDLGHSEVYGTALTRADAQNLLEETA